MNIDFLVNGNLRDVSKLTFRGLGFGEKIHDRDVYEFILKFRVSLLHDLMADIFNSFVQECQDDDEKTGCDSPIELLVKYNYPTFDQLLQKDSIALAELLRDDLTVELLEKILGDNPPENCTMAINRIASVNIGINGDVVVTGELYCDERATCTESGSRLHI